ncbi:MAG: hypothetical protein ACLGH8_05160 [Bacteroidia bacterium]
MRALALILFFISLPLMAQSAMNTRPAMAPKMATAYANKTEAKVIEFFGYLELLTDPKLNTEMKTQVKQQALSLFGNETTIDVPDFFGKKSDSETLEGLLNKAIAQKQKYRFTLQEISTKPLAETSEPTWIMEYSVSFSANKIVKLRQLSHLKEEYKQFGSEKKKVTTLYLAQAEEIK